MSTLRQIAIVMALNLKSLPRRAWTSLVIVVGLACVIGVLLAMLSLSTGIVIDELGAGDEGRAVVLSDGAQSEFNSSIPRDSVVTIKDAPGIARASDGAAIADTEILSGIPVVKKAGGFDATVLLRGFGPKALELRPEFKLVAGRMFRPGNREMIVGIRAQDEFANLKVGDKVILPDGEWPIVGSFSTGDVIEGELAADTDTAMAAVRRDTYNSLIVRLASPQTFDVFKKALTTNPALAVTVERHSDYYRRSLEQFIGYFNAMSYAVSAILALGALFGALNTMYAAVSGRAREIATLRAIGFSALSVGISVISEALVLAVAGALIGAAMAWFLFNGDQEAFGGSVINLTITPGLIALGIGWAIAIALLGALPPAIRAARLPVAAALRA